MKTINQILLEREGVSFVLQQVEGSDVISLSAKSEQNGVAEIVGDKAFVARFLPFIASMHTVGENQGKANRYLEISRSRDIPLGSIISVKV